MIDIQHLNTIVGIITILISTVGAWFAMKHFLFYNRVKTELSSRLKMVFLSDALIYIITLMFGLWAFFQWGFEVAIIFQYVRVPLLILNMVASVRLMYVYTHIKEMKK